jgi:hypothetical protein
VLFFVFYFLILDCAKLMQADASGVYRPSGEPFSPALHPSTAQSFPVPDDSEPPANPRLHGFQAPLDLIQIGAWVCITYSVVIGYTIHFPLLPYPASVACGVLYGLMVTTVVTLKICVTLMPNEDDALYECRRELKFLFRDVPEGKIACVYCNCVVHESSKHCSVCDKCVVGFDHHCRWLNACIGTKNYKMFIAFMSATFISLVFQVGIGLFLLIDCARFREDGYYSPLRQMYPTASVPALLAMLALGILIQTAGSLALGKLIRFHIFINMTSRTTYSWILEKKAEKDARGEQRRRDDVCCAPIKRRIFKKKKKPSSGENAAPPEPAILPNAATPPPPSNGKRPYLTPPHE